MSLTARYHQTTELFTGPAAGTRGSKPPVTFRPTTPTPTHLPVEVRLQTKATDTDTMPAMLLAGWGGVKQTVKGEVESWSGGAGEG